MEDKDKKEDKYVFGWSDPRVEYGNPDVKWEPIEASGTKYEVGIWLCYIGVAVGVSMTVAPMPWVKLFMWMLK